MDGKMKETKFRAWDESTNTMSYEVEFHRFSDCYGFRMELEHHKKHWVNVDSKFVMQYTGLKDKNGKEIYEGDLLKMDYHGDNIFEVVFDNGAFCIKPFMSPDTLVDDYTDQAEIIGNIYENPEMVK